ncbi:hypothetical protein [Streptomyces sp. NPDC007355]|uniref:hypothetical protein n=1 Tax=Streptomyces sp. NPDC007355 TaxID=3364778 RepID=UPI0036A95106
MARLAEPTREQNAKLTDALREGITTETARPDLDPDDVVSALLAPFNGLLPLAWRPRDLRVDAENLERLLTTDLRRESRGSPTPPFRGSRSG